VNVAARPALEPRSGGGMVAYVASKAAVAALTQALAAEVAPRRILVNAVAPSTIDTAANRSAMPQADHDSWPKPAEIAATIAFLASPHNHVTSGAIVPVYGRA
jgi:NAD(P)-dependent dehydrogenase (short-subunit alcohol dehydrogenase family)